VTLWRDVQDIRAALQEAGENFGESTLSRTVKELTDDGRLETQKLVRKNMYRITEKGLEGLQST
jgi:DNA-binding PadR family transcriptional regulator